MTIDDIKQLISKDEHRQLELKKTTGELKDGMHTACAFLNTDGGWLIIGIAPGSLKILGQEVTDNTQREIAQDLTGIEPAIDVKVEYVDVLDRPGCQAITIFSGKIVGFLGKNILKCLPKHCVKHLLMRFAIVNMRNTTAYLLSIQSHHCRCTFQDYFS